MTLGVEAPLLSEYKSAFKELVVTQARDHSMNEAFVLFPATRGQAKLLSGPEVPLVPDGGPRSFELYAAASEFNEVVGKTIDEFYRLGRFGAASR